MATAVALMLLGFGTMKATRVVRKPMFLTARDVKKDRQQRYVKQITQAYNRELISNTKAGIMGRDSHTGAFKQRRYNLHRQSS